jgi:hypothetical protein
MPYMWRGLTLNIKGLPPISEEISLYIVYQQAISKEDKETYLGTAERVTTWKKEAQRHIPLFLRLLSEKISDAQLQKLFNKTKGNTHLKVVLLAPNHVLGLQN